MKEQRPEAKTPLMAAAGVARPVVRFAWLVVAYNIAVTLWGAYVRATGSGAGCGSRWPLCNGQLLPSAAQSQTLIEFTHRVTSALALVLVFALVVWCWRKTSKGDWARYAVVCAGVLLLNEALLGALLVLLDYVGVDKSAGHAAFLCLHLGNTLLLLAALALTAKGLSSGERFAWVAKLRESIVIGIGLAAVVTIGMTGSLAALADTIFPVESLRSSLLQDFSPTSHFLLRLRLLHPITAAVGAIYVLWVVLKFSKKLDRSEWALSAIGTTLTLQIGLGVLNILLLAPIWLQMAHLFVADIFWILLVVASAELCLGPANSHDRFCDVDGGSIGNGRRCVGQS
jgi:cytochrome c oxidase assembly protein subunit 15